MTEAGSGPCTVLVCDDQQPLRDAIVMVINASSAFHVVGNAGDGPSCLQQVGAVRPDLLILDVNMPGGGPRVARAVKEASPDTYILVYSGGVDEVTRQAMLDAGADRYLVKTGRLGPLVRALQDAAEQGCCGPAA